jgi:hypothetical protein
MNTPDNISIQEVKYPKRIGYITLLNHAIISKLPNFEDLFNLEKISLADRFAMLKKIPGAIENQVIFENLTPLVGFTALTKAMTGNAASLAEIIPNVHALGSGLTAPASGDTQLQTETIRKLLASKSYSGNKAYYTAVYETSEANGTHKEMALFMNATLVANNGTMWDRSAIDITKTSAQSLTIDYEDTFINA